MSMILDGSNGVTFNDSSLQGAAASPYGLKNRIINGDMRIDQRNAGASVTITTDGQYTVDRWQIAIANASKVSVQQNSGSVTPPVGFSNYLGVTSLAATTPSTTDYYTIRQNIEGFNWADLGFGTANAKTVTLSFWVRSSLTGTFGGALQNSAESRGYPFSYSISAANTWEQKTVTITGDTSGTWIGSTNGIGARLVFSLGNGSGNSTTAGAWATGWYVSASGTVNMVATNGATFYITGVQLEVGSTATPFERRMYGTELQLCQRYYQKSYDINTAVPTNSSVVGIVGFPSVGNTLIPHQNRVGYVWLKTSMRSTPTVTIYSYTSSTTGVLSNGAGTDLAAQSGLVEWQGNNGFIVYNFSGSSITPTNGTFVCHYAASSEL